MSPRTRRSALAATAALAVVSGGTLAVATQAHAVAGCQVTYTVTSQWSGGFGANIDIKNLGDPINNWTLKFAFPADQTITQLWNGNLTQSGANVTVTNLSYNGTLGTNATVSPGFNGTWTTTNPAPTSFSLNGVTCTGTTPPTTPPTTP
ncbi:cellulose-binding domain-containing protein, partial [Streptomyces bryophytorum]